METKDLIRETALRLFNDRGIHEVGVREIARKLEISPGNLSYHFPKKTDLIGEIRSNHRKRADGYLEYFLEGDKDLLRYMQFLRNLYTDQYRYRCLYLVSEFDTPGEELAGRKKSWKRLFASLVNNREFKSSTTEWDIEYLVHSIQMINRYWIPDAVRYGQQEDRDLLIDRYLTMVARQLLFYTAWKGRKHLQQFFDGTGT